MPRTSAPVALQIQLLVVAVCQVATVFANSEKKLLEPYIPALDWAVSAGAYGSGVSECCGAEHEQKTPMTSLLRSKAEKEAGSRGVAKV